ncbi:hydrogenase small subunit [Caldichromatium japonicum]|uniref:hydrogenase (acceptor) n=1 Tax=Caldichromatium japonicum TaxID=2699430 RepID=A0A6G7VBG4_9GAMM|nr:hydrogenase small subunit [Caldichromatium japonicum]QIK37314.1 hydrogenase small subunit [Caldichromatium japonicum]
MRRSQPTLGELLSRHQVSRRGFLRFCTAAASLLALPPRLVPAFAESLAKASRPSVIWLSFQECTGCTESLTRSHAPTLEDLILNLISLEYHHTLQAASGEAAEAARLQAIEEHKGQYLVIVDGSLPGPDAEAGYSTIAGQSNHEILRETVGHAAAVIAVGTCAAFGGLPEADPNPTGARPIMDLVRDKPLVNVPGCPPMPLAIAGVVAHYLAFRRLPELDAYLRPLAFYGQSIHDRCYRRPFYDKGLFAEGFDDEGARKGWCLYRLGCKGPTTYNACAVMKWNDGTSWPVESGHPCLGCSEPRFWDAGGFYRAVSVPLTLGPTTLVGAGAAGVAAGAVAGALARRRAREAERTLQPVSIEELEAKQ